MRLCLGVGFVGFILKQINHLVQILYGAIWMTSQYSCIGYYERRCVVRHQFQRGVIWIQKTTVWWSGSSDHTLWNLHYQDWEYWWVYNKYIYTYQLTSWQLIGIQNTLTKFLWRIASGISPLGSENKTLSGISEQNDYGNLH